MCEYTIKEVQISNINYFESNRIGIVKIQMPEQCQSDGTIQQQERENNSKIIEQVFLKYNNNNTFTKGSPHYFLFPELSISKENAMRMIQKVREGEIINNTIIIFGMELITKDEFLELLKDSNSVEDFSFEDFGHNVHFVNTSVILIRDNDGNSFIYYQPKMSRSRYESISQFISPLAYIFSLGGFKSIVNICSDFILERDESPVLLKLLKSIDNYYTNPSREKIDFIFLLQKNKAPLGSHYTKMIKMLYFRENHDVNTSTTMVCSVNSISMVDLRKFRYSNVSVMNRGRPPHTLNDSVAEPLYAWKSFKKEHGENDSLHYVLWRIRHPGVISFIINTDDRPSRILRENITPIEEPGVERFDDDFELMGIDHIPETYEFEEILLRQFFSFVQSLFIRNSLVRYFGNINLYKNIFDKIFQERPHDLIETLTLLHAEEHKATNCDTWEDIDELFEYFLVSLAILHTKHEQLSLNRNIFDIGDKYVSIMDCDNMHDLVFREEKSDFLSSLNTDSQLLLLQRLKYLYEWSGEPKKIDELLNSVKQNKVHGRTSRPYSTTRPEYPYVLSLCYLVNKLNEDSEYKDVETIREKLNEAFLPN